MFSATLRLHIPKRNIAGYSSMHIYNELFRLTNKYIFSHFPFENIHAIAKLVDENSSSILDVGCGKGEPMRILKRKKKIFSVGLDIFIDYLKLCKRSGTHDEVINCDIRHLPLKEKSFDTIICLNVIEHLPRDEGLRFLLHASRLAKRQIIVATPSIYLPQEAYEDNPYQAHRSFYSIHDFSIMGFEVISRGFVFFYVKWQDKSAKQREKKSLSIGKYMRHILFFLVKLLIKHQP